MSRRKREEAMIYQQAVANALKNEENDEAKRYHRAQLEETKRHNIVEEETKDRVDISKKEYLELLEKIKNLKSDLQRANETIEKIFKPLVVNKVEANIINKMLESKFRVDVKFYKEPSTLEEQIIVTYKVPLWEKKGTLI